MSKSSQLATMVCTPPHRSYTLAEIIDTGKRMGLARKTSMQAMSGCPDIRAYYDNADCGTRFKEIKFYRFIAPSNVIIKPPYFKRESYVHWVGKFGLMGLGVIYIARCTTGI